MEGFLDGKWEVYHSKERKQYMQSLQGMKMVHAGNFKQFSGGRWWSLCIMGGGWKLGFLGFWC